MNNGIYAPGDGNHAPMTEAEKDAAALAHMYDDEIDAPTAAQLTEQLTAAIRLAEGGQR